MYCNPIPAIRTHRNRFPYRGCGAEQFVPLRIRVHAPDIAQGGWRKKGASSGIAGRCVEFNKRRLKIK